MFFSIYCACTWTDSSALPVRSNTAAFPLSPSPYSLNKMSKLTTQICIEVPTKEGIRYALQVFYQEYRKETSFIPQYSILLTLCASTVIAHPYASSAVLLTWAMYPDYPFRAIYTIFYAWPSAVLRGLLSCLGVGEEGAPQRTYSTLIIHLSFLILYQFKARIYPVTVPGIIKAI